MDKQPTEVVINSIRKRFPNKADEILAMLKYDYIMGCWYFIMDGVFFGVEHDGYIHT